MHSQLCAHHEQHFRQLQSESVLPLQLTEDVRGKRRGLSPRGRGALCFLTGQAGAEDSPVGVWPHFFQPRGLPIEDLLWIGDIEEIELGVHGQRGLLPGVKGLGTVP